MIARSLNLARRPLAPRWQPMTRGPRRASTDTIYALSSGPGRAAIAVIRLSGPACLHACQCDVYRSLCPGKPTPRPRMATMRKLLDKQAGVLDPQALVLFLPGPATVTGEDVLELHVHGGRATVRAVLAAVPLTTTMTETERVRYAEPGEFTRRAFLSGKMDLAQVEALGHGLEAETELQRRAAVEGSSGSLGRRYEAWRRRLLEARAELEALIDFSEDQHFDESPAELMAGVVTGVEAMVRDMKLYREMGQRGDLLRRGIRVALLGPPNVGKSSLMNIVVGREASIVSDEAGTTRDVVEASLDLRGYLCSFADTAGFRAVGGKVEAEGMRRARVQAGDADVVVVVASIEVGADGPMVLYDAETVSLSAGAPARPKPAA
ncbi:hypothetical protein CDD80_2492 [Ophiocordyceps camponoti-rufipedis]|uniref:TrmE-type G domain-containing protein n=1 Tax=Ophiocordyceps camponoti-rufipedis TaxID=2004952 RepID=A0A2C5Z5M3_9HYPO|nr:hypothetical protein CDD80_2492 [Ophiocordyceps camponoti-rufipedis]